MNTLGIDTSNYTTSAAIYDGAEVVCFAAKLLPVKKGEYGIRQNDAVFHHTAALPEIIGSVTEKCTDISAVGVSDRPECREGSYMPCFSAGVTSARIIGSVLKIPVYTFSHQQGHIAAAVYSAKKPELFSAPFIAFHLSGGTTEAVLVKPDKDIIISTEFLCGSLDLKAGQAVDRVGKLLGLDFPAGIELEKLAKNGCINKKPKICIKDGNCCLSGLENTCKDMLESGESRENIALFCLNFIAETLSGMTDKLIKTTGNIPLVYAGGVMSNTIIRKIIEDRFGGIFAPPEFSRDNAFGTAVLTGIKYDRK